MDCPGENESMKTFLSPVRRVCAEIAEMTSNVTQVAWPTGRASSVSEIGSEILENTDIRAARGAARHGSIIGRRSGALLTAERSQGYGVESPGRITFDVASFCLELDAWRVSLTSTSVSQAASEYSSFALEDLPAARCGTGADGSVAAVRVTGSLERELTNAIRKVEQGSSVRLPARADRKF